MTGTERIARIRISLSDIEPEIWRRVDVPLDLKGAHEEVSARLSRQG